MDEDNDFDILAYFYADTFAGHIYHWYKNECMIGNAVLLLSEKWENKGHYVKQNFDDLNEIPTFIRDGKKREALSWINNVLSKEAKEQVTPDIYEYLQN
jgi:hypothetical protein